MDGTALPWWCEQEIRATLDARGGCLGEPLRNRNMQRMMAWRFETDNEGRVGGSGRQAFVECTNDREAEHAWALRK